MQEPSTKLMGFSEFISPIYFRGGNMKKEIKITIKLDFIFLRQYFISIHIFISQFLHIISNLF